MLERLVMDSDRKCQEWEARERVLLAEIATRDTKIATLQEQILSLSNQFKVQLFNLQEAIDEKVGSIKRRSQALFCE